MRLTKEQLKQIIKEELNNVLYESKESAFMGGLLASMLGLVDMLNDYSKMRQAMFSQDEVTLTFDQRVPEDMKMFNDIKEEYRKADLDWYMTTRDDSRETTLTIPIGDYAEIVRETNDDPLKLEDNNKMLWNRVQQMNLQYNSELGYKGK
tara:strand:- start:948 stop:1397 length:450 start_codon:yes stop_codon:yes gene_type:complete